MALHLPGVMVLAGGADREERAHEAAHQAQQQLGRDRDEAEALRIGRACA